MTQALEHAITIATAGAPAVEPALLTEHEAARFLSLSPRMFRELIRRGDVTVVRVPGVRRVAFDVGDLRALVARWKGLSPAA